MAKKQGRITIDNYFTKSIKGDLYKSFNLERYDVDITDDDGKLLWVQKNVEFPKSWSPLARKITASKYFFGEQGTSQRESSIRDLVGRVSDTIYDWSVKDNYFSSKEEARTFADEFAYIALDQRMSPNSPAWFNIGVHKIVGKQGKKEPKEAYVLKNGRPIKMPLGKEREYPQTSACFIQSVEDTMESIMDLAKNEALLFKYGSGTGTNLSTLRSSREKLSSGGVPSGPLAYWAFYDKVAGIVKSGGKTRRAAKMDILNVWHPDIVEFIGSKKEEERILHILIDNGVDRLKAQESVNYQNTNIAVRINDAFLKSVENDEEWQTIPVNNKELADEMPKYKARELLRKIAEANHFCADPGIQYHDTINRWHTCPNTGEIKGSNPCSEYMSVDDSSCNLASQNLLKFMGPDDTLDTESFGKSIRITAIAQDLFVNNSSYPTKKIAKNSHDLRPLGMGYANLGSLVMSLGLPYDSDEARAVAAAITAFQTGKIYETSTEMAEKLGTFEEFEKNKEPMLNVMKMHKDALLDIERDKLPKGLEKVLDEAEKTWDNVIKRGEKYGFRNSQASVLAPTGTIGFFMDCDTKGIEPEMGLVQTKLLSDGGTLRLVNRTVKKVLPKLGYDEKQVEEMIKYIDKNETIEGAPHIHDEHLPIFDCANKPKGAKRTISYQGHLKMMAAVQPFISGAISKTVNLPEETPVEDIENVLIEAGNMGIKAVTLYRDNCKRFQPMNFTKKKVLEEKINGPVRRKLPITTDAKRHKFNIAGHEGYIHVGMYEDGTPGELFANMSKQGSTIGGLIDAFATSVSFNLQYGVPLRKLVEKFKHQVFEPKGLVWEGHPDIKEADSPVDYFFQFMEKQFLNNKEKGKNLEEKEININNLVNGSGEVISLCGVCSGPMIQKGPCNYVCSKCGWINPKGCGE